MLRPLALLAGLAILLPLPTAATAAQSEPTAAERMAPLAGLVGEWHGSGWMMLPDGSRSEFESREIVTTRLGGAALLVEGRHWRPGQPEEIVHDAIALIHWDNRAGGYRFRSALANGMGADFPLEVGEDRFAWRLETQAVTIEYETDFSGGRWRERGRRALPDGGWADFFEMTLERR